MGASRFWGRTLISSDGLGSRAGRAAQVSSSATPLARAEPLSALPRSARWRVFWSLAECRLRGHLRRPPEAGICCRCAVVRARTTNYASRFRVGSVAPRGLCVVRSDLPEHYPRSWDRAEVSAPRVLCVSSRSMAVGDGRSCCDCLTGSRRGGGASDIQRATRRPATEQSEGAQLGALPARKRAPGASVVASAPTPPTNRRDAIGNLSLKLMATDRTPARRTIREL
jgi:hypothetical protein